MMSYRQKNVVLPTPRCSSPRILVDKITLRVFGRCQDPRVWEGSRAVNHHRQHKPEAEVKQFQNIFWTSFQNCCIQFGG